MFKKGDVLQCKYGNQPVRLLTETWQGITDLMPVQHSGYFLPGYCSEKHYDKISYWKWLKLSVVHTVIRFVQMFLYKQDKNLGLVNIMTPDDYWRHRLIYKEVLVPQTFYGCIKGTKRIKVLIHSPVYREIHYSDVLDKPIWPWFCTRVRHMLPTPLLK